MSARDAKSGLIYLVAHKQNHFSQAELYMPMFVFQDCSENSCIENPHLRWAMPPTSEFELSGVTAIEMCNTVNPSKLL